MFTFGKGKWEGDKYIREHKDGEKHGQGTLTSSDGDMYEGEFKDGKYDGQGTYTWSDGGKYEGKWKDGKRNGQGTVTFPNGDEYFGSHKAGMPWNGTVTDKKGKVAETWTLGKVWVKN